VPIRGVPPISPLPHTPFPNCRQTFFGSATFTLFTLPLSHSFFRVLARLPTPAQFTLRPQIFSGSSSPLTPPVPSSTSHARNESFHYFRAFTLISPSPYRLPFSFLASPALLVSPFGFLLCPVQQGPISVSPSTPPPTGSPLILSALSYLLPIPWRFSYSPLIIKLFLGAVFS